MVTIPHIESCWMEWKKNLCFHTPNTFFSYFRAIDSSRVEYLLEFRVRLDRSQCYLDFCVGLGFVTVDSRDEFLIISYISVSKNLEGANTEMEQLKMEEIIRTRFK